MSECICGRPLAGAAICSGCSKSLEIALGNIPAFWRDLDNVRTGQTRYGDGSGGRRGETSLPLDPRFAGSQWVEANNRLTGEQELQLHIPAGTALMDATKNTIATWTRTVMGERPVIHGPVHPACLHITCAQARRSRWPADTVQACCVYLLGHIDWIRTQIWAPEILDELQHIEGALRRVIDRPAGKWFAGPCDTCERDMYARDGALQVHCDDCDLDYPVAERRDWLWEQAQDVHATAAEIARAVSWIGGTPLADTRIRKWVERKRLIVRGHITIRGRVLPLYRLGDVTALIEAHDRPKAG